MSDQFQPVSERRTPFIGQLPRGLEKLPDPIEEDTFYNEEQLNKIDVIREEIQKYIASRLRSEMGIERLKGKKNRLLKRRELLENFRGMIYGGPEPFNDLLSDRDAKDFEWADPRSHERMFGPLGGKI